MHNKLEYWVVSGELDEEDMRVGKGSAPVRQQLVDVLRRAILSLRFRPGQHLIERELCALTGVSRTSLREGLRQLEGDGLVEIIPHKGPRVAKATARQAREIYDARVLLESYLGRVVAQRATASEIEQLRLISIQTAAAIRARDKFAVIAAKNAFYALVLNIVDNGEIAAVLRKFFGRLSLLWPIMIVQGVETETAISEIDEIVEAIAARDSMRAGRAFEQHMLSARRLASDFIESGAWDAV